MSKQDELAELTRKFSNENAVLAARVQALVDELEQTKRRKLPGIRTAVANTTEARSHLKDFIEANTDMFDKPRTQVINGIKVGLAKGKGGLEYEDEEKVIQLVRKHLSEEEADLVIKAEYSLLVAALANLDVSQLKKIGVNVVDAGDRVVIKPTDGGVDKIVKALLKDAEEDSQIAQKEAA